MTAKNSKKYPMTISNHLDKISKHIVDGDNHFRGNRNQFYIEAIELAVVRKLGADALKPEYFDRPVEKGEPKTPSPAPAAPASTSMPKNEPASAPSPDKTLSEPENDAEKEIETYGGKIPPGEPVIHLPADAAPEVKPKVKPGLKPVLEWRDGGIRDQSNRLYELTYGPALLPGETREQQFDRCKRIPKVVFETVTPKSDSPSELANKIVVDSGAKFEQ
jgi:hypothetical protein